MTMRPLVTKQTQMKWTPQWCVYLYTQQLIVITNIHWFAMSFVIYTILKIWCRHREGSEKIADLVKAMSKWRHGWAITSHIKAQLWSLFMPWHLLSHVDNWGVGYKTVINQGPILLSWIVIPTVIPSWINNYIHYEEWGKITIPFSNFNGFID